MLSDIGPEVRFPLELCVLFVEGWISSIRCTEAWTFTSVDEVGPMPVRSSTLVAARRRTAWSCFFTMFSRSPTPAGTAESERCASVTSMARPAKHAKVRFVRSTPADRGM